MAILQALLYASKKGHTTIEYSCGETNRMLRGITLLHDKEIEDLKNEVLILENRLSERDALYEKLKKDNKDRKKEIRMKKSSFVHYMS